MIFCKDEKEEVWRTKEEHKEKAENEEQEIRDDRWLKIDLLRGKRKKKEKIQKSKEEDE